MVSFGVAAPRGTIVWRAIAGTASFDARRSVVGCWVCDALDRSGFVDVEEIVSALRINQTAKEVGNIKRSIIVSPFSEHRPVRNGIKQGVMHPNTPRQSYTKRQAELGKRSPTELGSLDKHIIDYYRNCT